MLLGAFMKKIVFLISVFYLLVYSSINAQTLKKPIKIDGNIAGNFIDINNIQTVIYNNGLTDINLFAFPKHSKNSNITAGGFLFGVKLKNEIYPRVGGSYYASGLQPGIINTNGTASDPNLSRYRVFRVRPDVYPGGPTIDLSDDSNLNFETQSALRTNYEKD